MSIYLQGRKAELVSVVAGYEPVIEVWSGDSMVWPDITDSAGGIIIEPPPSTSEDYRYWLHALDAIETLTVGNNCYLKFEVDGVEYYINKAPRGAQRVVLEGNIIKLNKQQQAAMAGKVGETIIAKAKVPAREAGWRTIPNYNNPAYETLITWSLPLIEGTYFRISAYKGQKREHAYNQVHYVTSLPSNTRYNIGYTYVAGARGRYFYTLDTGAVEGEFITSDYAIKVSCNLYGAAYSDRGITVVYPGFEKEFELTVVAVY